MMQRQNGYNERPNWKWTIKRCAPPALTAVALWSGLSGDTSAQSGWKWFGKQGPQVQAPATPQNGFASSVQRLMEQARQEAAAGQMSQAVATAQRAHKIADAAAAVLGDDPQCSPAVTQKFLADMQVLAQTQGAKSSAAQMATARAVAVPPRQQVAVARPVVPPQQAPAIVPKTTEREQWLAVIRSGETATPRAAAAPPVMAAVPARKQPAAELPTLTPTSPVVATTAPSPAVAEISLRPQFAVDGGDQAAVSAPAPLPTSVAVSESAPVISASIMPSLGIAIEGGEALTSPHMAATVGELPAWGSDLFRPSKPTTGLPIPVMIRWSSATQTLDTKLGFSTEIVSYDDAIGESVCLPATPPAAASPVMVELAARPTPVSTESVRVAIPVAEDISFAPSIALLDEPAGHPEPAVPVSIASEPEPARPETAAREETSAPVLPVRVRQYPVANALAVREAAVETAVEVAPELPVTASSTMPSLSQPLPLPAGHEGSRPTQGLPLSEPAPTEWSSAVPGTARQPRAAQAAEDSIWQPSRPAAEPGGTSSTPSAAVSPMSAAMVPREHAMIGGNPSQDSADVVAVKHESPRAVTRELHVVLPAEVTSRLEAPAASTETVSVEAGATVDVITIPRGPSVWTRQASLGRSAQETAGSIPSATSYLERLARRWKLSPTMLVSLAGGAALFLLGCSTYLFARRQNPA